MDYFPQNLFWHTPPPTNRTVSIGAIHAKKNVCERDKRRFLQWINKLNGIARGSNKMCCRLAFLFAIYSCTQENAVKYQILL